MLKRHVVWSWVATLMIIAVGCKAPGPAPTTQPAAALNSKSGPVDSQAKQNARAMWDMPDTDKPVMPDIKGADAQALAQATQDYARTMQMLLAKRNGASGVHSSSPPTQPSAVNAGDPSRVHFDETGVHPRSTDAAAANAASTAGANIPGDLHSPREQVASVPQGAPTADPGPTITQTPSRPEVPFNKDSPAVNTPLIVGQPRPLPGGDELTQKLQKQMKENPQDLASQLDWQLLQFLQGQSVPQLQSMTGLQAEDREILSAVLDGMTNFRNALKADNNMLLSRKVRPMLEMSDRLRTQAELGIPTIALCTDVKGFGVYEPLEPARFPADSKEHRVIVYCEVENFSSQLDEQKRWQTKLTQDVVLYTEQGGLEIWRDKTPARPITDYSRNRRHDFFIVKMVRLPAALTIGRYLLKVTVTDQEVNRVAENTVPITIVAP